MSGQLEARPIDWNRPSVGRQVLMAVLVVVGILGAAWYFTGTATVYLENRSYGHTIFYVDDVQACDAQAGTQCTVRLYVWKPHTLRATTYYGSNYYVTPLANFYVQRDAEYEYISCGMTGTPQQNCGLFAKHITPPAY